MMAYSQGHICHCLGRVESLRRDSPLFIAGNRRRTGREFADAVLALARGLTVSGVARGDVVAIAALNSDWYMELFLAVAYIGGVVAPLNYRWSFEEARSAMETVRPKLLAVDESCSAWALELQNTCSVSSLELYLLIGECSLSICSKESFMTLDSTKKLAHCVTLNNPIFAQNGVALICFTSGTTGKPKGVAISHVALIVQSLAKIAVVGYSEDDVYLHTAPLCHIGGISSCMSLLYAGGCHILIPKFNAKLTFQVIRHHQVTSFICVPAMMADLIAYSRKSDTWNDGKSVNKILNGGGGLSKELTKGAICLFPCAKIFSAYGMTETCSSLTFMKISDPTLKKSEEFIHDKGNCNLDHLHNQRGGVCVGRPAPHVELRISGSNGSHGSPSIGSILTRGLHVMIGYWSPNNTSTIDIVGDEWLYTGDIGWIDDKGDLWLVSRVKDRIKSGGENVYPEEVEAVLSQHPGISNVVVVGIPDSRLIEKVVACIKIKDDWEWITENSGYSQGRKVVSPEILQKHCKQENLSRFKIPKDYIQWKKAFPVTNTGKLRRNDVKMELLSDIKLSSKL